jgi:hypothetical protein
MRDYRFARQPFMSPFAVGTGPIIGLMLIVGILLMLVALGAQ